MAARRGALHVLLGLVFGVSLACAYGCLDAPPSHALRVRHPERKCALIWFSGCTALLGEAADESGAADADEDAGVSAR